MKVITYVRVSTNEQAENGVSLEAQAEKIQGFCTLNGWHCIEVVRDDGCGRWRGHPKAERVENCLALDVFTLGIGGVLTWTNARGEPVASMGCELDVRDPETPSVILRYTTRTGETVVYRISLLTTRPHFGGLCRWFACPLCARRVGKLYLPPGETYFGCRACFGLTYRSSQQCHKVDLLAKARKRLKMIPVG